MFFWGVSLGLFRVSLGFVWGKFQILSFFLQVYLSCLSLFGGLVWGLFRVGLGCIYVMHLGVYLGVRSKKTENNGEAEQWRSRETKKHKSRSREKQRSRKAKKQGNRNPKKCPKRKKNNSQKK